MPTWTSADCVHVSHSSRSRPSLPIKISISLMSRPNMTVLRRRWSVGLVSSSMTTRRSSAAAAASAWLPLDRSGDAACSTWRHRCSRPPRCHPSPVPGRAAASGNRWWKGSSTRCCSRTRWGDWPMTSSRAGSAERGGRGGRNTATTRPSVADLHWRRPAGSVVVVARRVSASRPEHQWRTVLEPGRRRWSAARRARPRCRPLHSAACIGAILVPCPATPHPRRCGAPGLAIAQVPRLTASRHTRASIGRVAPRRAGCGRHSTRGGGACPRPP